MLESAHPRRASVAHDESRTFFDDLIAPDPYIAPIETPEGMRCFESVDGGHGRVESRRYWVSSDIEWFEDKEKWEGLQSIGMVESVREIGDTRSYERRLYLTSLPCDAKEFAKVARGHWGVENPLHWTLDVTFREDDGRARSGHAAENMASLRRLALNILKSDKAKPSLRIRRNRLMAGWNGEYVKAFLEFRCVCPPEIGA